MLACIVVLPFMAGTALAVKLDEGGPVLYKQERLTIGGREFYVYKFRSMRIDAEKDGVARLASAGDNRYHPSGKFYPEGTSGRTAAAFQYLKG